MLLDGLPERARDQLSDRLEDAEAERAELVDYVALRLEREVHESGVPMGAWNTDQIVRAVLDAALNDDPDFLP